MVVIGLFAFLNYSDYNRIDTKRFINNLNISNFPKNDKGGKEFITFTALDSY